MESTRLSLIALLCAVLSQKRISGEEVEMRVRPGDHVTIHCDLLIPRGSYVFWFRNCSHENQPPFVIQSHDSYRGRFARFSFEKNSTSKSFDLRIKNVTEKDLGLYYCAKSDQEISTSNKMIVHQQRIQYGNWSTRLSLIEEDCRCSTVIPNLHVPEGSVSRQLMVVVVTVCVLVSSVLSCICVYCLCGKRKRGEADQTGSTRRRHEAGELEVCYASLDVQNLRNKKKKTRAQGSDFSTYSEVQFSTGRAYSGSVD